MLVLGRKNAESILLFIDGFETIEIKVTEIRGSGVRIGITAPSSVTIVRKELVKDEPISKQVQL